MIIDYIKVGKRITIYRQLRKMSQARLAEKVYCSPSYVSHIERGVKTPSLEILVKIADVLQVTTDQLVTGSSHVLPDDQLSYYDYQALLNDCTAEERSIILSSAHHLKTLLQNTHRR